jgi:hypothetical protein
MAPNITLLSVAIESVIPCHPANGRVKFPQRGLHNAQASCQSTETLKKALPGFEPGLAEHSKKSESAVIATTL